MNNYIPVTSLLGCEKPILGHSNKIVSGEDKVSTCSVQCAISKAYGSFNIGEKHQLQLH